MRLLAAAGLAGICLATSPLYAADLFGDTPPPIDQPSANELGTNWYLRGDVGYGQNLQPTIVPADGLFPTTQYAADGTPFNDAPIGDSSNPVNITRGNNKSVMSPDFDLGFGYRINDWFRVEGLYDFSKGPGFGATTQVYCPGSANSQSNIYTTYTSTTTEETEVINGNSVLEPVTTTTQANTPSTVGYGYDWSRCNGYLNASQYNNLAMAAGYVDLGTWGGIIHPYIGAGVGVNANTITGSLQYYNVNNGTTYTGPTISGTAPAVWLEPTAPTAAQAAVGNQTWWVPLVNGKTGAAPKIEIGPQNWYRNIDSTKYTIAGSIMAGVGVAISQSAMLDIGYRYIGYDVFHPTSNSRQSINVGVRYNLN